MELSHFSRKRTLSGWNLERGTRVTTVGVDWAYPCPDCHLTSKIFFFFPHSVDV